MTFPADPADIKVVDDALREYVVRKKQHHVDLFPDGCPDWCEDCNARLTCKDGRHEWPNDFSDGDTCYCGAFYLMANCVDERPHIIETPTPASEAGD